MFEQGIHVVAPLVLEKLEPSKQEVHTVSDVFIQAVCWYVPGEHTEQGVHDAVFVTLEKVLPVIQSTHLLF